MSSLEKYILFTSNVTFVFFTTDDIFDESTVFLMGLIVVLLFSCDGR